MADVASESEQIPLVLSEIQSGGGLSPSATGRQFPGHRGNGTVDPSTVFRWITKGATTPSGVVKLEAVRVGGRWLTSRGAVARFVAALTAAATPAPAAPTPQPARTATARSHASERAAEELKRLGA